MRGLCGILLAALAVMFVPNDLAGQADRDGFFIGFGFGLGSLGVEDADDRESAFSGYFKIGGAINDKVLLGAESNGWIKNESEDGAEATLTSSSLTAVAYLYPSPESGFYLKGGAGLARLDIEASGFGVSFSDAENGTALTLGLGFDYGFGGRFALTPYANLIYSSFEGGTTNLVQVGLGVNWY